MSHSPDEDKTDTIPTFNSRSDELSSMIQQGRSWSGHERNSAFLNIGNRSRSENTRFANISAVSGLDFEDDARGIAVLDWDHDGDLDLWVRNRNAPNLRLMRNEVGQTAGNFFRLQLQGDGESTNRDAIGARVEVSLSNSPNPLVRTVRAGDAFLSQSSKILHFGLGTDPKTVVEKVVVRWPDREGTREEFTSGLETNRTYRIEQGKDPALLKQRESPNLKPLPVELPVEDSAIRVFAQSSFPLIGLGYHNAKGERVLRQPAPGKWTLINLWATWCAPCRAELKDFTARAGELKEAGIDVIALSVDLPNDFSKDSPLVQEAAGILQELQFPFPSGFAEGGMISHLQGINNNMTSINRDLPVPSSFLINPARQFVAIYKGVVSIDQVLADAKEADYPIHERLEKAISLEGSLVPSETIREQEISNEAAFQFFIGREMYPESAMTGATHFAEALRIKPDFIEPRIHLGIALNKLNQLDAAQQQLKAVLAQNPGEKEKGAAYYQLSEIALKQGRINEAMPLLESTLQNSPDHPMALNNLAFLLASKNPVGSAEFQRALTMAERAVELTESQQPNFLDTLGGIYTQAERFDDAVETFEKALALAEEQEKDDLVKKLGPKLQDSREQASQVPGEFRSAPEN